MFKNENQLLEEAYLSIAKKSQQLPSDEETVGAQPNEVVSAGPMDEPAPGVDMDMINSEVMDTPEEDMDTTGVSVSMQDPRLSEEDEDEEDDMSIDNLDSIRDSIMKIASHCAKGDHLEPWQQQKLAIAMDNLAEVARRLPRGCHR